ncbi:adrenocorticotropic hormone receptor-like [Porites lutea]|uniref:adrenocorticotropic hormone receptor-like n=1 Tax=Porites lutea TaxID=51062 RepID=UPI003CC6A875
MGLSYAKHCENTHSNTELSYFTASIATVFCLATVIGNFLVCLAIVRDPFGNMKTPFHYFLLSLSGTDLLVGLLLDPTTIFVHIREARGTLNKGDISWDFQMLHMLYFILSTASVLTLAALTADRYVSVTSPVKYKTKITCKRAIVTSVIIWVAALGFSLLYFKVDFFLYSFIFANTAVLSTFFILLFTHRSILRHLRNRSNYWRDRRAVENTIPEKQKSAKKIKNIKQERKVARALLIVLLTFLVSFVPVCGITYLLNFCLSCNCMLVHWLRDIQALFVCLNSAVNPYLYAWRFPQFRKAFLKLLHLK